MTIFQLHLVSDATGETLSSVAKAALAQFEDAYPIEHVWTMVRNRVQLARVIEEIKAQPGIVMCTIVDHVLREELQEACFKLKVPYVPVLEPAIGSLANFLGSRSIEKPGRQHMMDAQYFARIEAMQFCMNHDDGQGFEDFDKADVVLVGVSRTSKTPTCIYLANRGVKAANIPFVPGVPLPEAVLNLRACLVVGLVTSPDRLLQIRKNRLLALNQNEETDYVKLDAIKAEVQAARRICAERQWPVIDVTRRSIEETAAEVMSLMSRRQSQTA